MQDSSFDRRTVITLSGTLAAGGTIGTAVASQQADAAIGVGDTVHVAAPALNAHADPDSDTETIRAPVKYTPGEVVSGPVEADGHTWFEVTYDDDYGFARERTTGWSVAAHLQSGTPGRVGGLSRGDTVEVSDVTLGVRPGPSWAHDHYDIAKSGEQGAIITQPRYNDGCVWWGVRFDSGAVGWVSATYIELVDEGDEVPADTLAFTFSTLPELDRGHYEGWAIYGSEKVSTGTFTVGDDYEFSVDRDLSEADKLVITIEPENDTDDRPSGVAILAGAVEGTTVDLSFPVSFEDASGTFLLGTPSDDSASPTAGIWFIDVPSPSPSLELPNLPSGWTYEGWVVADGTPLTTGRFDDPASGDDFDGFSGPQDSPDFPGEDFLRNAPSGIEFPLDLSAGGYKAVISVEPDIDGVDPTGDNPFAIKPLAGEIPRGVDDHTNIDLDRTGGALPAGTAMLK
jgi:hypothetical protein